MSGFFSLGTAKDMFAKAGREYDRLRNEPSIDNIFNFFVTAYHVVDYLPLGNEVTSDQINALRDDPDMQRCAHVCNKGKHAVLTQGDFNADKKNGLRRPSPIARVESGALGCSSLGTHSLGGSPPISLYYPDTREHVAILPLADRVMKRLVAFVEEHKL